MSINNHIVGSVHKNHIIRTWMMYHAACKVEFQPFKRSYSQLTFSTFYDIYVFFCFFFLLRQLGGEESRLKRHTLLHYTWYFTLRIINKYPLRVYWNFFFIRKKTRRGANAVARLKRRRIPPSAARN